MYFDDAHTTKLREHPSLKTVSESVCAWPGPQCTQTDTNTHTVCEIHGHKAFAAATANTARVHTRTCAHAQFTTHFPNNVPPLQVWFAESEARVPYTPLQATHYTFAGVKQAGKK